MRAAAVAAAVAGAAVMASCARGPRTGVSDAARIGVDGGSVETRGAAAAPAPGFRDEPWSYAGRGGRVVVTPHYRVHMTQTEPVVLGRVPVFLEAALGNYRTIVTRDAGRELPAPRGEPMSTYVFRERWEWERMTRQLLGEQAGPFLRIQRGGYAWGGTAVLFDLSEGGASGDTLKIAAHEGWHQFTQRTFRQSLPAWLEESIATLCEGYRWTGAGVEFTPEDNPERRELLMRLAREGRLASVERLTLGTPANLGASGDGGAVDYYAQVWGLGVMLRSRHGGALAACVEDACAGRMAARVVEVLGRERAEALSGSGRGLAVLEAYFAGAAGAGVGAMEAEFRGFVSELAP